MYSLRSGSLALVFAVGACGPGSSMQSPKTAVPTSPQGAGLTSALTSVQFAGLLQTVADGWQTNNARMAADCFTEDAVYIEPPDQQLYLGRQALYEFFGGDSGRSNPMTMDWHHVVFDEQAQLGMAEYTFGYKGRLTHGIVLVQVVGDKIHRWREYQIRSTTPWLEFIGKSRIVE